MSFPSPSQPFRLILGYGNTLRQDDGLGYLWAEQVQHQSQNAPGSLPLKSLAVHQLTPDLAAIVSEAQDIIFGDVVPGEAPIAPSSHLKPVADTPQGLVLYRLQPIAHPGQLGHQSNPAHILALCQTLYGVQPPALWLLMPGEQFGYGETLSPLGQTSLQLAVDWTLKNPQIPDI